MLSIKSTPAFDAFVDPARLRPAIWRVSLGFLCVVTIYLAGIIALSTLSAPYFQTDDAIDAFFSGASKAGALFILGTFAFATIGVWIAARVLHKRSFASLVGPRAVALRHFGIAALVYFGFTLISLLIWSFWFDAAPNASVFTLLSWLPIVVLIVLIQTSAEELVFRGYLMQQLAARFASPLVWFVAPQIIFAFLHFDPALNGGLTWPAVGLIFITALIWADLTRISGTIGAACGWHFANNFFLCTVIGAPGDLDAFALFVTPYALADMPAALLWMDLILAIATWLVLRRIIRR